MKKTILLLITLFCVTFFYAQNNTDNTPLTNEDFFTQAEIYGEWNATYEYWLTRAIELCGENNSYDLMLFRSSGLQNIALVPNPTTGEFRISFAELAPTGAAVENGELRIENVEIFDIYGRNIYPTTSNSNIYTLHSINLTVFPAGIYFVKITTEQGAIIKKVIKN